MKNANKNNSVKNQKSTPQTTKNVKKQSNNLNIQEKEKERYSYVRDVLSKSKNTKTLADKFLEYNSSTLESADSKLREVEPSNNKLYYTVVSTQITNSPISNSDYNLFNSQSQMDTNENYVKNNSNNKGISSIKNEQNEEKSQKSNTILNNKDTSLGIANSNSNNSNVRFSIKNNNTQLNNNENSPIIDIKEDTLSLNTGILTSDLNSENKSESIRDTKIKNNFYNKLLGKSKTPRTQSVNNSLYNSCKNFNSNNENKTDISILKSIHDEKRLSSKKKIAGIFRNLVMSKLTFMDISKEELFSNESSKF